MTLFAGCAGTAAEPEVDASSSDTSVPDVPDTSDAPDAFDTAESDTPDTTPPTPSCASGLTPRPFDHTAIGAAPGALAGDFEAMTLAGPWRLSDHWTGCDSHVFLVSFPEVAGLDRSFFKTSPELLFRAGPSEVHYHFVSDAETEDARVDALLDVASRVDAALATWVKDEASIAAWRERIHYVSDRARDLAGSPGDFIRGELAFAATPESIVDLGERGQAGLPVPFFFAIDPAQRLEHGDNLAPTVGAPQTIGMAAFLPSWLAWRVALEQRLAHEPATLVPVLDERTTARVLTREVDLPSAWSSFDTLELDLTVSCDERNPFACSEWDRIASVHVCRDGATCSDRLELARWITPYWRRGAQRYLLDASPLLPLLGTGRHTLQLELGPEWERPTPWRVALTLRLRDLPDRDPPAGALLVARGGPFDAAYGASTLVTVPAGATRVELVALLSGHGQTEGDNCAEWCDHRHTFSVDDHDLPPFAHDGPALVDPRGCATRAADGLMPGQWGNWAPQRAFWCPGLPVPLLRRDLTGLVTPSREHRLSLRGTLGPTSPPRGGDVALSAYLVWY